MSEELDKVLHTLLDDFAESYHPEHEYNADYRNQNTVERADAILAVMQAFTDAGYMYVPPSLRQSIKKYVDSGKQGRVNLVGQRAPGLAIEETK